VAHFAIVVFPLVTVQEGKTILFSHKLFEQMIFEISNGDYIRAIADAFPIDRQAR
jgi:hypothetical protein